MKLSEFIPISGIYKIINVKNNKIYIGKSKNIHTRWGQHIKELIKGKHSNKNLLLDFQKFGLDYFEVEVLEICDEKELSIKEAEWAIKLFQEGNILYNSFLDKRGLIGLYNKFYALSGSSLINFI